MLNCTLFLMAKYPQAGRVKSRLIPVLGAEKAARLAEAFLLDLMERLTRTPFPFSVRKVLCFDPPEAAESFKILLQSQSNLCSEFILLPQAQGHLGARLQAAVLSEWGRGSALVLMGADAPDLPTAEIQNGFEHAQKGSAYLQYASDGGYVLLALPAGLQGNVFAEVPWSQADTGARQAARLQALNIPLIESASVWSDVDLPADLAPLKCRLKNDSADPKIAPRTLRLLEMFIPI